MRTDFVDLAGQRFGRWRVLSISRRVDYACGQHEWLWRCRCGCGAEVEVRGRHLRSGESRQCVACGRKSTAAAQRARSKALPDGRNVATIAMLAGLKTDTVAQRLRRGWEPWQLCLRPLRRGERRDR